MQDFSAAPPPIPRSLLTPAATIPGKPKVKAPIPPAWSSRRREITVDRCRLSLSDGFISASPEHERWLSQDLILTERFRSWQEALCGRSSAVTGVTPRHRQNCTLSTPCPVENLFD